MRAVSKRGQSKTIEKEGAQVIRRLLNRHKEKTQRQK